MTPIDVCRVASSLGGVMSIVLGGVGFIVRMTPPMDGTAVYWWGAAVVAFVVASGVGLIGLLLPTNA